MWVDQTVLVSVSSFNIFLAISWGILEYISRRISVLVSVIAYGLEVHGSGSAGIKYTFYSIFIYLFDAENDQILT